MPSRLHLAALLIGAEVDSSVGIRIKRAVAPMSASRLDPEEIYDFKVAAAEGRFHDLEEVLTLKARQNAEKAGSGGDVHLDNLVRPGAGGSNGQGLDPTTDGGDLDGDGILTPDDGQTFCGIFDCNGPSNGPSHDPDTAFFGEVLRDGPHHGAGLHMGDDGCLHSCFHSCGETVFPAVGQTVSHGCEYLGHALGDMLGSCCGAAAEHATTAAVHAAEPCATGCIGLLCGCCQ